MRQLLFDLTGVDWAKHNTTTISDCITKLNSVRRTVGIPFKPF